MELLGDTVIVLASQVGVENVLTTNPSCHPSHFQWQVVFFLVGWIFFVKMLFRDYELHHILVQLIFCVNFRYHKFLTLSNPSHNKIIFQFIMHHVRAYNLRDRQLFGQKFKVNRFNVALNMI